MKAAIDQANTTTSTTMPTTCPFNPKKKFRPCFISAESQAFGLSDCFTEDVSANISLTCVSTTPPVQKSISKETMKVLYLCDEKVIYNPSDESEKGRLKWIGIMDNYTQPNYCSIPKTQLGAARPALRTLTVNSSPSSSMTKNPIRVPPVPSSSQVMSINVTSSMTSPRLSEDGPDFRSISQVTTTTINILYAEDNIICRTMTSSLLAKLTGIQCDTVKDGLECCKKVEENPQQYHLILMDILMPIMGGIDATARIRQLGFNIPIIAVSQDETDGLEQRCTTAGMNGFLRKPLTMSKLKDVLSQQKVNKV